MVKTAIAFLLGCTLCLNLSELPRYGWLLAVALPFTFRFFPVKRGLNRLRTRINGMGKGFYSWMTN